MYKSRSSSSPSPSLITNHHLHYDTFSSKLSLVPFSWEEKPGVAKKQESNSIDGQQQQHLHLAVSSFHIPDDAMPMIPSPALRKPPRLEPSAPPLSKTPSFHRLPPRVVSSADDPPSAANKPQLQLVRKQSFDNLIHNGGYRRPLARKYSHGSLVQQSRPHRRRETIKMEDDPFLMAVQVCRKEPIRVLYHNKSASMSRCGEEREKETLRTHHSLEVNGGRQDLKRFTMRQLLMQQLQQEEEEYDQRAQKQPLVNVDKKQHLRKKHDKGALTFLVRCLGC